MAAASGDCEEEETWGVLLLLDNAPVPTSQVAVTAATKCSFEALIIPYILQI